MSRKPNIEEMLKYLGVEVTPEIKKVLSALRRKPEVDENKLAEALKTRVNDIRKVMYTLASKGVVKYIKEKSEDKQWWYIYLWRLDEKGIRHNYLTRKMKELMEKMKFADEEKENMFRCSNCSTKFTTEQALENSYSCPECGGVLTDIKRKGNVAQLERDIRALQLEIKALNK